MKDLEEVKKIISQQISRNLVIRTIKVIQSIYIRNLLKSKNISNFNTFIIFMKVGPTIEIKKLNNYKKKILDSINN